MGCVKRDRKKWSDETKFALAGGIFIGIFAIVLAIYAAAFVHYLIRRSRNVPFFSTNMDSEMSDRIDEYIDQDYWGKKGKNCLGIVHLQSLMMYCVKLDRVQSPGSILEWVNDNGLCVNGRMDTNRGYFSGTVAWDILDEPVEAGVCIINFATGEKMLLEESLHSFVMGDYYISCQYVDSLLSVELLIFYCPPVI